MDKHQVDSGEASGIGFLRHRKTLADGPILRRLQRHLPGRPKKKCRRFTLLDIANSQQPTHDSLERFTTISALNDMGVWDVFTGKKSAQSASGSPSSEFVSDPAGNVAQPTFDAPTAADVSSFISTPGAFDPAALHPLAGLNQDTLDYLTLDDSALSDLPGSRSVQNLCVHCHRRRYSRAQAARDAPLHDCRLMPGVCHRETRPDVLRHNDHECRPSDGPLIASIRPTHP